MVIRAGVNIVLPNHIFSVTIHFDKSKKSNRSVSVSTNRMSRSKPKQQSKSKRQKREHRKHREHSRAQSKPIANDGKSVESSIIKDGVPNEISETTREKRRSRTRLKRACRKELSNWDPDESLTDSHFELTVSNAEVEREIAALPPSDTEASASDKTTTSDDDDSDNLNLSDSESEVCDIPKYMTGHPVCHILSLIDQD